MCFNFTYLHKDNNCSECIQIYNLFTPPGLCHSTYIFFVKLKCRIKLFQWLHIIITEDTIVHDTNLEFVHPSVGFGLKTAF